jgi:hypothetical protein
MQEKQPVSHGILTPIQRNFLTHFRTLPDAEAFYLTGGTALAEFYLGHRLSFDLDLFTTEAGLIRPFSLLMEDALRYFILQETDFWELIDMAARKDPSFDPYWMAHALMKVSSFPDEQERWPVQMLQPFAPLAIKDHFVRLAYTILERIQR